MTQPEAQFLGVHHVLIAVPPDKKAEAKHFYEEVIGFVPLASPLESSPSGNMWWYECGHSEFHVALLADYQAHQRPHAAFLISNLPALRARLKRHGIEPRLDYSYRDHWRIYVTDPWNNRTEYIEPLPPGVTPGMTEDEISAALATAAQLFPITQQFRDEVEKARQKLLAGGQEARTEQRDALELLERDTLTREEIAQVASAFSMSPDLLLTLTNDVREVGAPGGPG